MKKRLLMSLMALSTFTAGFAQFVITSTSVTYTGHTVPAANTAGQFYKDQPNNSGGTYYYDNACTQTTGSYLGGWDANIYPGPSDGVVFYGGDIRRVFYGTPCTSHDPSVGFHTGTSAGIGSGTDVDLSLEANQQIVFSYSNVQEFYNYAFELQLYDQNYQPKLTGATFTIVGDGNSHTVTIDFSDKLLPGADMSNIRQVSLIYTSTTPSHSMHLSLFDIYLGSSVATGVKNQKLISSSTLFPNPTEGNATAEFQLTETSEVKLVVTDVTGKAMNTVLNNSLPAGTHTAAFDLSGYSQGMYYVNYFINNEPTIMQMLMVK